MSRRVAAARGPRQTRETEDETGAEAAGKCKAGRSCRTTICCPAVAPVLRLRFLKARPVSEIRSAESVRALVNVASGTSRTSGSGCHSSLRCTAWSRTRNHGASGVQPPTARALVRWLRCSNHGHRCGSQRIFQLTVFQAWLWKSPARRWALRFCARRPRPCAIFSRAGSCDLLARRGFTRLLLAIKLPKKSDSVRRSPYVRRLIILTAALWQTGPRARGQPEIVIQAGYAQRH